mmetsp:Transcript_3536/g.6463  ORF Transcript_3536/g.6463 Transcript_3536/m.6463 type:complete len:427 (+) Transcript_3536:225-1505(+)
MVTSNHTKGTDKSRIKPARPQLLLGFVVLISIIYFPFGWSFQQYQPSPTSPSLNRASSRTTALPFVTSSLSEDVAIPSKRSNRNYFALDYRDVSSTSKSRLSLSTIALPSSAASGLINDGSDYYSWISSDWGQTIESTFPRENVFAPRREQQQAGTVNNILQHSEEYKRRKEEWAKRYTSLSGLREAFGSNRNKLWGDLDAATTRKLYKTLLPNALCELVLELGVEPEELAPLAYKARKAAKLYARERCQVPARILANLFDGYRQWRRYGKFQTTGMSYEQLWEKYYHQQLKQLDRDNLDLDDIVTKEEIVSQTCQKILEKSCTTNDMIDQMVLGNKHPERDNHKVQKHRNELLLERISNTLESDVRKLLDPSVYRGGESDNQQFRRARPLTPQEYHALKLFALARKQSTADELATKPQRLLRAHA